MKRVIIFGAYGVFGSLIARELAARQVPLTVAGRDRRRTEELARSLGGDCRALAANVFDPSSCRAALEGHAVAVNCAGPFHESCTALLDACLEAGCDQADIADNRAYNAAVRRFDERFRSRGLAAVYGCSSLPGISGALALRAAEGKADPVDRVRVTLLIGNRNPKGRAAVESLLVGLGQPIVAPQGMLYGFHDREVVSLPPPFGRRSVFNFDSSEYDLFPSLLGARSVSVKVGFELRLANYTFALLARLGLRYGRRTARLLGLSGRPFSGLGHSGAVVMAELFFHDGNVHRASASGRGDGQRMAALPCVEVAHALSRGDRRRVGAASAYEFLGADVLLQGLESAGFVVTRS